MNIKFLFNRLTYGYLKLTYEQYLDTIFIIVLTLGHSNIAYLKTNLKTKQVTYTILISE